MTDVRTYTATAECVKFYALAIDEYGNIIGEVGEPRSVKIGERNNRKDKEKAPSELIDELARELVDRLPHLNYAAAVKRILEEMPELALAYSQETGGKPRIYKEGAHPGNDPSKEANEKALRLMDRGICKTYSEAAERVLTEDPKLRKRWSEFASMGVSR